MSESVVVIGANGFVGRHLTEALAAQGQSVIALVRQEAVNMPRGVDVRVGDFERPEDFAAVLACARAVVHAGSRSTPGQTAGKPLVELDINLRPTLALLSALQNAPQCSLLYRSDSVSKGEVFYSDTRVPNEDERDCQKP